MKFLKTAVLAGVSLLAMTAHASADPISIGFFLFAGPLGSIFTFGALVTAAQIGLYAIGIGASLFGGVLGQQRQKIDPGQYKNIFESSESSEVNAIGRVRLGGLKIFGNTTGVDRYRLIGHTRGPLIAIEEYKLGGREVTVEASGAISSPPFNRSSGVNDSYVFIATKIGDGTEGAWARLITAFPSLWTSDHRVRGIAQSLVQYVSPGIYTEKFGRMYQGGEPELTITCRVNKVYDPRVPGAGKSNPATWVWSTNGPLCAAHIMRSYPDLTVNSFDWDDLAIEATKADVLVDTLMGTEPRSQCSGIWLSENKRGDTMKDVLTSIGAEVVLSDEGLIRIRLVDDEPEGEIKFTTKHMTEFSWRSGPEAVERPNVCRVKYYSPERNYEMADIDMTGIAWARIAGEVTRYGEKVYDVELPFCSSASQAQRIARREFMLARADSGVVKTNMAGLAAWGLTYVNIELPDLDETPVCKIAPPRIDDDAGEVEIPFAVWPPELIDDPWDPVTMEAPAPEQVPDIQFESELDTPAAPSEGAVVQYPGGGAFETRVRFTGVDGGTIAEANYRTYTGGEPDAWASMTEYQGGGGWIGWAADDARPRTDFRVRFFNSAEEGSYFSDPLQVDPMAIDNTATGAPSVSTLDGTLHISVPELRAVKALVETSGDGVTWGTTATNNSIRPYVTWEVFVGIPVAGTTFWRVSSFTSNDTQGAYASGSFSAP